MTTYLLTGGNQKTNSFPCTYRCNPASSEAATTTNAASTGAGPFMITAAWTSAVRGVRISAGLVRTGHVDRIGLVGCVVEDERRTE